MAFQAATGYQNLPNGNFSPVIYSKKVQKQFRKKAVVMDVVNSDYMGEIANMGDSVRIMKEPEIVVNSYARGTQIVSQSLDDEDFTLTIDQSNYWSFTTDDIEKQHSHVNFQELATNRAGYRLAQKFDEEVLGYLSGYKNSSPSDEAPVWSARTTYPGTKAEDTADNDELLAAHKLTSGNFGGTTGNSIVMGVSGTYDATPLAILNRMNTILDLKNVDRDGRWIIVDPIFLEILQDEDSKFMNHDYQSSENLTNGMVTAGRVRGFRLYSSNNLPFLGTGPSTATAGGSTTNYGVIIAGHDSAVTAAEQMSQSEKIRSNTTFGDILRGMHLYGRKILRSEGLVRAIYNQN